MLAFAFPGVTRADVKSIQRHACSGSPEFTLTLDGTVSATLEVVLPPEVCVVPGQSIHLTALLKAEYNKATLSNVLSPPGCSRKLDLPIDPNINRNKLRLLASGTVAGRTRRDNDIFGFRH